MDAEHIQVFTAVGSRGEADRIANGLVDARLAACVQIVGPIASRYRWAGKVESAEEWLCIAKTRGSRFEDVARAIREEHSYEVPEITALPIVGGLPDYLGWIDESVS
ncbi:MAG: divalent-cation tolerance protein CutA [Actinomycetota bacterium]